MSSAVAAAPVFESPVDLSSPGAEARAPQVGFDGAGNALAAWIQDSGDDSIAQSAFRPLGGAFTTLAPLSSTTGIARGVDIEFDGAGNALVVWSRWAGSGANEVVQAAFRPAGGAFSAPIDLSASDQDSGLPQAAFDNSGNAIVVWTRNDGTHNTVQSAFRPAGGTFASPVDISDALATDEDAFSPQVAFDGAGNALVVWHQHHYGDPEIDVLQSSFRPVGGAFAAAEDIASSAPGDVISFEKVAFDGAGNALVTWTSGQFGGGQRIVKSAFRPAGSSFGVPADISLSGQMGYPDLAFDGAGNAIAVWTAGSVAQSAFRPAGGSFGAPLNISAVANGVGQTRVATDSAGNALAIWIRDSGANQVVQTAFRPSAGAFGTPVSVSASGTEVNDPEVSFDSAGNALAVWDLYNGANSMVQSAFASISGSPDNGPSGSTGGGGSTPPASNVFTVGRFTGGTAGSLTVTVPGPGTLTSEPATSASASAKKKRKKTPALVSKSSTKVSAAGSVKLAVKLSSAGKKQLKKKKKLKVKVKITFTPTGGSPSSKTTSVTFKKKK